MRGLIPRNSICCTWRSIMKIKIEEICVPENEVSWDDLEVGSTFSFNHSIEDGVRIKIDSKFYICLTEKGIRLGSIEDLVHVFNVAISRDLTPRKITIVLN